MDVIKNSSLLPPSPLTRPPKRSIAFQKFAEFNVLPLSSSSNVSKLQTAAAKLPSSTDVPRKGNNKNKPTELKKEIVPKAVKSSEKSNGEAELVVLEKLARSGNMEFRRDGKQHPGHLVWKELQELTKAGDNGTARWLSYKGNGKQPENAPLFLCLPGILFFCTILFNFNDMCFSKLMIYFCSILMISFFNFNYVFVQYSHSPQRPGVIMIYFCSILVIFFVQLCYITLLNFYYFLK